MSIRDTLNENRTIVMAVAILVTVAAAGLAIQQVYRMFNPVIDTGSVTKFYFTDDDGATIFAENAAMVPPFDHNGKEAVRAHVFHCKGKPAVVYMERFTPERKQFMQEAKAQLAKGGVIPLGVGGDPNGGMEIKKPGKPWILRNDRDAGIVMDAKCDDGSDAGEEIYPQ